ncbi:unnamed protein product [Ixodes hexagonus]
MFRSLLVFWGHENGGERFHASAVPAVRPEVSNCRKTKATEASRVLYSLTTSFCSK